MNRTLESHCVCVCVCVCISLKYDSSDRHNDKTGGSSGSVDWEVVALGPSNHLCLQRHTLLKTICLFPFVSQSPCS